MTVPASLSSDPFSSSSEPAGPDVAFTYRFLNVEYDATHGDVRVGGRAVAIERRPRRLLEVLLAHVNEVVTKEELFETVWDGRPTVEHVLTNAVSKLRTALGPEAAQRIVTVPRTGYRLLGPVQRINGQASDFSASVGQPVPGADGYVFERRLGAADPPNVWLARHAKLGVTHVFKFATEGARLTSLKREYTLYRVLQHELGARDDFARVVGNNFSVSPFFLKCESGGESLLEWADGGRLAALAVDARIALFLQTARAVAAAHSVGVLHKDLKPGNVLIEEVAQADEPPRLQVRLTDFGSGRLLDPSRLDALRVTALGLTQTQYPGGDSRGGTPLYLAPELIAGHAPTVQSDVYALGILLFQMLVGDLHRPFSTGWQREIAGDLLVEDITAATEGEPSRRLVSAGELVERLQRLGARIAARQQEQERQARLDTALEDARRRRLRRPWLMAAALCLVLGLAASLWFERRASQALTLAERDSSRARAINDFLDKDVLATTELGLSAGGTGLTMVDVVRRASRSASERFVGQPETEASVRLQLGQSNIRMRSFLVAESEFQRVVDLLKPFRPAADPELLTAEFGLSEVMARLEHVDQAKRLLEKALSDAAPEMLASTSDLAYLALQAQYQNMFHARQIKEALPLALRLRDMADARAKESKGELNERLDARLKLADVYFQLEDTDHSAAATAELSAPPFNAASVGAVLRARTLVQEARVDSIRNDGKSAELKLLSALSQLRESVGELDYLYGSVSHELAEIYEGRGDFVRCIASLNAALRAFEPNLGAEHQNVHLIATNLAIVELDVGHAAAALPRLDAQRAWFIAHGGQAVAAMLQAIDFQRAKALNDLGRSAEALATLRRIDAAEIALAAWGGDEWQLRLKAERGRALVGEGRYAEGAALLKDALGPIRSLAWPAWQSRAYETSFSRAQRAMPVRATK